MVAKRSSPARRVAFGALGSIARGRRTSVAKETLEGIMAKGHLRLNEGELCISN